VRDWSGVKGYGLFRELVFVLHLYVYAHLNRTLPNVSLGAILVQMAMIYISEVVTTQQTDLLIRVLILIVTLPKSFPQLLIIVSIFQYALCLITHILHQLVCSFVLSYPSFFFFLFFRFWW
jgi:hypothetical protein